MSLSTEQFLLVISKTIDLTIISHSYDLSDAGPWGYDEDGEDEWGSELSIRWFDSTALADHRSFEEKSLVKLQPASIKYALAAHLRCIDISAKFSSTPPESYEIKLTFEFPTVAGSSVEVSTTTSYKPYQNTLKHDKFIANHIPADLLTSDTIEMMNDLYVENYSALTVS